MKKFIMTAIAIFAFTHLMNAQKIDIKKDIVSIDGVACLKIGGDSNNVSISTLEGEEIVFLKFARKYGDLYNKITFLEQKVTFTSQSYIFTKKLLIKKLLEDGTLKDCKLDSEKVEKFALKYDEKVE
ncbi:hypothetical protein J2X31_001646 [Flavobacterium arsenatis]|uniref:DUF4369 domain-containing protein n=1 Tax=Flavobacterium arsenatis TaxID=1484332 RepID=A0ABU1TNU8_9FLAO|nr:hypothetical protein [Flavobacterium arsenatis]MDR6967634.1 hypothetical protein [Flavobacterium arsenatis]